MSLTVKTIVAEYLKTNGYDGLYDDNGCGCKVDDLMPCDGPQDRCKPGFKTRCHPETCALDGDCGWHIGPKP